jgi:hypothetical protein
MRSGRAACVLTMIGVLIGPGSAGAHTLHRALRFTGDCRNDCGGARGVGAGLGGGFGSSVSLSADGGTLLAGAPGVHGGDGAALVFARWRGGWRQQGLPLTGACPADCPAGGPAGHDDGLGFGLAVALSARGGTALVGAPAAGRGLAWVFVRRRGRWARQGSPLLGFCSPRRRVCSGPNGTRDVGYEFGVSVALSADGNTAVIGQSGGVGGVWVFVRSGGGWSQQAVLTGNCQPAEAVCTGSHGTGETPGTDYFGDSVAVSGAGDTVLVGGPGDDGAGAVWVFVRSGGQWSQQGPKLVGDCVSGCGGPSGTGGGPDDQFGSAVALSDDGDTALVGAPTDGSYGAAWVFVRTGGDWNQQGPKLAGGCAPTCGADFASPAAFGEAVALDGNGNEAFVGAPVISPTPPYPGAVWLYERVEDVWKVSGSAPVTGRGDLGDSVALSGSGGLALAGADAFDCTGKCPHDIYDPGEGTAWLYHVS